MKSKADVIGKVLTLLGYLFGVICLMQGLWGWRMPSEFDRLMALMVGIWVISMNTFDNRLRAIDQTLTMIAMGQVTSSIVEDINSAYKKVKEMHKYETENGKGAKANEKDFDTTAKTGAHE